MPPVVPLLAHALRYAKQGFYVFPTHNPSSGKCSCGLPLGPSQGQCTAKHPRVPHWPEQATRSPEQVAAWWAAWPDAGIGIVTGKSGFFAVDLDVSNSKHGGSEWATLLNTYGSAGDPQVITTGSGGSHLLYRYVEGITNSRGGLRASAIDVRGAGGYIIAPPSMHWTGKRYLGEIDARSIRDAPPWLVELLRKPCLPSAKAVKLHGGHALSRADLEAFIEHKRGYADAGQVVEAAQAILADRLWAPYGRRHTTMVALLGALRTFVLDRFGSPVDPESVADLFAPSLAQMSTQPETSEPTTREWLLDLLARLSAGDGAFRGKLERSREKPNGNLLTLSDDRSWILGTNAGYFLRTTEGYVGPFSRELVLNKARDVLVTAPGVNTYSEEGKPLSLLTLMDRYGQVPTHVRYSYCVAESSLVGDSFVQRTGHAKTWTPEYNAEIAEWLRLFGGEHHDALLDWLATVHDVSKPTCALCILGYSGAGKDLLVDGVSAIWGGNTAFTRALGRFNEALLESPIVVANEGLRAPTRFEGNVIDALKEMVSARKRKIEAKFAASVELEGSVRLLIATNNTGSFKLDRQPNESDLLALHDRVLLIQPTAGARPYLEALGGLDHTEAWVAGGGLPRHIEWLRRNRQVQYGLRFIVQGNGGLAALLAAEGKESGPVLRAALRALLDPAMADESVCCARGGAVWVSQANLKNLWATFGRGDLPEDLGEAFKAITEAGSGRTVRTGERVVKMRQVKLSVMRPAAVSQGVEEELEEKILKSTVMGGL